MKKISSLDNKIIKEAAALKEAKNRKKSALFLVDGKREIELALQSGFEIQTLFFLEGKTVESTGPIAGIALEKIIEINGAVFKKIAYKENPDGYLAIFRQKKYDLEKLKVKEKALFLILDDIEKPGNLGAIIRSAGAFGVDGIVISDSLIDIYNPNVIRASEALVFFLPVVKSEKKEIFAWLKKNKIESFAAATQAGKYCHEIKFNKNKIAIIFGSEARGLDSSWLEKSDHNLRIPMKNGVDSLNLSVSAAIMVYEFRRQQGFSELV